jgi:hypothetical protein
MLKTSYSHFVRVCSEVVVIEKNITLITSIIHIKQLIRLAKVDPTLPH